MPSPAPAASPTHVFTLALDSINILNTRSAHKDTDFVSFTVRVTPQASGGKPFTSLSATLVKALGDLDTGQHPVGLTFPRLKIEPGDTLTVNYIIINAGKVNPFTARGLVKSSGDTISTISSDIGRLIDITPGGAFANRFFDAVTDITGFFGSFFSDADCDGTVAVEQAVFTSEALLNATAQHPMSRTTTHNGTDSPHGCGKNSVYQVTWHIQQDHSA